MKKFLFGLLLIASSASADISITVPGSGTGSSSSNVTYAAAAGTVQNTISDGALAQMNAAIAASTAGASNNLQAQITLNKTNSVDPVARASAATAQINATNGVAKADVAQINATNALAQAQTAQARADAAYTQGTNGVALANTAQARADSAYLNGTNGVALANTAQGTANTAQSTSTNALTNAVNALATANLALAGTHPWITNSVVTYSAALTLTGAVGYATHNFWISTANGDLALAMTNLVAGTLYSVYLPATGVTRTITLTLQPSGTEYYYGGSANNVWTVPAGNCGSTTIQVSPTGYYNISRATGVPR